MTGKACVSNRKRVCWIVFAGMFFTELAMHLNCDTLFADDGVFYTALDAGGSLFAFLLNRWNRWSSRLIIEAILAVTTHSIWVWRILDCLVMTGIAYALFRFVDKEAKPETAIISCLMILSIPFRIIRTTGWQATSVNYTWPMCAAFLCLLPSADVLQGNKPNHISRVFSVVAAILAANQEQMAVLLFLGAAFFILSVRLRYGKTDRLTVFILIIAAMEIVLHLLCPGNRLRSAESVCMVNLRDYGQFTLPEKLSIGLTSTAQLLFYTRNRVFWICLASIFCTGLAQRRPVFLIPVCLVAPLACLIGRHWKVFPNMGWLARYSAYDLQTGPARILEHGQLFGLFFWIFAVYCIAVSLYVVMGRGMRTAAAIWCYTSGFASRMVLSFSPTVVESGERTILPLYACLMLSTLLCVTALPKNNRRILILPAVILAVYAAFLNVSGSFALAM